MNSLQKVILFGATSSIAEQVARRLVIEGSSICCVGRSPEKLEALLQDLKVRASSGQIIEGIVADLLDFELHAGLIESAKAALGGVDGVLIAHGSLPNQEACEASFALTLKEIETNAISVISLLTELANDFEKRGSGVIAVVGSVAGDRGRQSNYIYGASKGFLTIFLQGLRNRLATHNVDVVAIKPGLVDTPMTAGFNKSSMLWAQPEQVAAGIVKAMANGKNEVYLPWFWRWIMMMIKSIPESLFKRMSL